MIETRTEGLFDAIAARLTARVERRIAALNGHKRIRTPGGANPDWRSAERLWPEFAPRIERMS